MTNICLVGFSYLIDKYKIKTLPHKDFEDAINP